MLAHTYYRADCAPLYTLIPLLTLVMLSLTACTPTFPGNPQAFPRAREIERVREPYYPLVKKGVASRLLEMQPPEFARALLSGIEARWPQIAPRDNAQALVVYLRSVMLTPIADRILETLDFHRVQRPPHFDIRLEAEAIKLGLVQAFYEAQKL